jgi:tRNA-dihydrouridine synthase B
VRAIAVHGRTRCQFFSGRADWRFIREVKARVSIPVIANGDLNSLDDAAAMLSESGADGVMIGRGAFGRPWFPAQVRAFLSTGERRRDPPLDEQRRIVGEHYEAMLAHYGIRRGLRIARKHLNAYLERLGIERQQRQPVLRLEAASAVHEALDRIYGEQAERRAA